MRYREAAGRTTSRSLTHTNTTLLPARRFDVSLASLARPHRLALVSVRPCESTVQDGAVSPASTAGCWGGILLVVVRVKYKTKVEGVTLYVKRVTCAKLRTRHRFPA